MAGARHAVPLRTPFRPPGTFPRPAGEGKAIGQPRGLPLPVGFAEARAWARRRLAPTTPSGASSPPYSLNLPGRM
jgi:hypothetical protein